jgi:hypothetical protein
MKKDFEGGRYANPILQGRCRRKIDSAKRQTRIAVCVLGAGALVISAFFLTLLDPSELKQTKGKEAVLRSLELKLRARRNCPEAPYNRSRRFCWCSERLRRRYAPR